jgi:hypothetical protein
MPECEGDSGRERAGGRSAEWLAAERRDTGSRAPTWPPQDHEAPARRQAAAVAASAFTVANQAFIDALAAPSES